MSNIKLFKEIKKIHKTNSETLSAGKFPSKMGYTSIPNCVLDALAISNLNQNENKIIYYLIRNIIGWNKKFVKYEPEKLKKYWDMKRVFNIAINSLQNKKIIFLDRIDRKLYFNFNISQWKITNKEKLNDIVQAYLKYPDNNEDIDDDIFSFSSSSSSSKSISKSSSSSIDPEILRRKNVEKKRLEYLKIRAERRLFDDKK